MPWIDATSCGTNKATMNSSHPCDPQMPCDPAKPTGNCQPPFLCLEKIKNPPVEGEQKNCLGVPNMGVKSCKRGRKGGQNDPHPCDTDPFPSCVPRQSALCRSPSLCIERIKNLQPTVGLYCPLRNKVPGDD